MTTMKAIIETHPIQRELISKMELKTFTGLCNAHEHETNERTNIISLDRVDGEHDHHHAAVHTRADLTQW